MKITLIIIYILAFIFIPYGLGYLGNGIAIHPGNYHLFNYMLQWLWGIPIVIVLGLIGFFLIGGIIGIWNQFENN